VLLKVNHPNVIRCYDVVEVDGRCYIITEICFGGDLDVFVKRQGYLSEAAAAGSFIKDVYEGLVYLAGLNIVHRDLKVANVFISGGRAKIADFGFAVVNK
jgi:serine/threonine-protein kinase ULK/ATG1